MVKSSPKYNFLASEVFTICLGVPLTTIVPFAITYARSTMLSN